MEMSLSIGIPVRRDVFCSAGIVNCVTISPELSTQGRILPRQALSHRTAAFQIAPEKICLPDPFFFFTGKAGGKKKSMLAHNAGKEKVRFYGKDDKIPHKISYRYCFFFHIIICRQRN